jgi:hypothetical protein
VLQEEMLPCAAGSGGARLFVVSGIKNLPAPANPGRATGIELSGALMAQAGNANPSKEVQWPISP